MIFGQLLDYILVEVVTDVVLAPTTFYASLGLNNTTLQFNGLIKVNPTILEISVDGIVQDPHHLIWRTSDGEGSGIHFLECVGQLLVM